MGREKENRKVPLNRRHSAPARSESFIGKLSEAPHFLQDNEHIRAGYRIGFDSPKKVIKSLFMLHNETVNIWTHLLGAIIIIFLIFQGIAYEMEESHVLGKAIIHNTVKPYLQPLAEVTPNFQELCALLNQDLAEGEEPFECTALPKEEPSEAVAQQQIKYDNSIPTWPIIVGLIGGSICLGCSAVFHLFLPMNERIYKSALMLDFAGIGINMAFSPIPAFYYTFYCNWDVGFIYIAINIIGGTASFVSNLFDWTHRKENRVLRFAILVSSALSCVAALVHMVVNEFYYGNYGDSYTMVPSVHFYIPTLLCYGMGFFFYLSKCPQRRAPGKFDICGHSHQIWHVFVFLAIAFNYLGNIASFEMRSVNPTCPLPFIQYQ